MSRRLWAREQLHHPAEEEGDFGPASSSLGRLAKVSGCPLGHNPGLSKKIKLGSERGSKNNSTILVIYRGGGREDGKPAAKIREHDIITFSFAKSQIIKVVTLLLVV